MNGSDDDIRWLEDQQPATDHPTWETTRAARESVMAHAAGTGRLAPVVAAPAAKAPRRGGIAVFARPRRIVAMAAAVTAVAAAGVAATLAVGPSSHGGGIDSALAPGVANAQVIRLLADKVADAPTTGDATLVFHRNVVQGEQPFTGADLYADNGKYYYAPTPSGLSAAIQSGPQDYSIKGLMAAMSATSNSSATAARAAFLKAADPLYGGGVVNGPRWRQDNVIWVESMDVLGAAYGHPAALAGTLRALSTVKGVTVAHSHLNGVPTLEIRSWVPKMTSDYPKLKRELLAKERAQGGHLNSVQKQELLKLDSIKSIHKITTPGHYMTATLNSRTGAFVRYTDIGLVVTYHVSRVNLSRFGS